MRDVGAIEAKSKLGQPPDMVEHGEELVITRRGRAAAKLMPASSGHDRDKARRIADQLLAVGSDLSLGGLKIEDLIGEGRR